MDSVAAPGVPPIDTPPSTPILVDHGLQVHLHSCSIMSSKCISELHHHVLQMHLQTQSNTASKCISEFNLILASQCISDLLDHSLQMHLQTRSIMASKFIYELHHRGLQIHLQNLSIMAWKGISELHDLGLQVHLQTCPITASKCISGFTWSRPPSASLSSHNNHLTVYLWVRLIVIFRGTSICSLPALAASPDIPCVDG